MESDPDAPVGIFDSGVGGLTVLHALMSEMPWENFLYLGDTARLPYGTKSSDTVARYAMQAAELLVRRGVKSLVIACNTASSVGLGPIRNRFKSLPVIGVIEPGARAACAVSRSGRIAVIGTERTVNDGAYERAIHTILPLAEVSMRAAPLFVSLAEEGLDQGPIAEAIAHHYLDELLRPATPSAPDTLVLGCTHFPMLLPAIRTVAGGDVRIVDSAQTTARAVSSALSAHRRESTGGLSLLATDSAERFARIGSRFLERSILPDDIELVDL
jgi:glutamate racemase